ncbi:MAG: rhodanese-like domain-containing protein [Gammaproteobacteria bacterium]|uniref:rhodanese-like domain-containing protein n=1 Tax=Rhodoferax sp. TaxID=50421 RepID=UPI0017E8BC61|nr:rhodanese-like domain-containing protein [Rhodoferax sp.]MBU3900625.1 rhodanese-like domain-containing protein [Gammaproteobacteria bacterium]MBA3057743.1 rhodanese-like domain-containing protein [Rhodoferax sp.]MBU3996712.1 rhodanese-like domain-containing protein [Gammaproteobacteria bacterium]MBU4080999.1 rhodanese-like domain-containing protein [Gammaproteobacteria bacterium]MBU4112057.1 rhodanese-like domain-containing protein [Gammaproteobacteria bacterium]
MKRLTVLALAGAVWSLCAQAQDSAPLRITKQSHEFVVQTPNGPLVITRAKTACGFAKGFIQPFVPQPGVTPVTEIDVLHALNDPSTMVIDMRDEDAPLDATIPNSYHIPYNELEDRMAELGCQKRGKNQWDCTNAFKIVGFCHGPMCLQSPAGIASLVRMGFPVNKISYYRGGMMAWEGLGLTTVTGNRPTTR